MKKTNLIEKFNSLVILGKLPWAFYNLSLKQFDNLENASQLKHKIWKPYKQVCITLSDPTCLISKIYHVH